jgi:hypothetical protein
MNKKEKGTTGGERVDRGRKNLVSQKREGNGGEWSGGGGGGREKETGSANL